MFHAVEKRRPTYDLEASKLVGGDARRLAMTVSAARSARGLGLDRAEIAAVVRSMRVEHFYKSMTSYADHRRRQDVNHLPWQGIVIYPKFSADVIAELVVLSFKER